MLVSNRTAMLHTQIKPVKYYVGFNRDKSEYAHARVPINGVSRLSFGGWFRCNYPNSTSDNTMLPIGWHQTGSWGSTHIRVWKGSRNIEFRFGTGSSASDYTVTNTPSDFDPMKWNHYCATLGDGYMRLYLNGEEIGSKAVSSPISNCDYGMMIAAINEGSVKYSSTNASRVFVSYNTLSASQVKGLCNTASFTAGTIGGYGLFGAWNMDDGTGMTAANVVDPDNPIVIAGGCTWKLYPKYIGEYRMIDWIDTNFGSGIAGSVTNPTGAYAVTWLTGLVPSGIGIDIDVVSRRTSTDVTQNGEWNFMVGMEYTDQQSTGFKLRGLGSSFPQALSAYGNDMYGLTLEQDVPANIKMSNKTLTYNGATASYTASSSANPNYLCIGGAELCRTKSDAWKRVWKGLIGRVVVTYQGSVVGDFRPAVDDNNGQVGFVDMATGEMFCSDTGYPFLEGTLR